MQSKLEGTIKGQPGRFRVHSICPTGHFCVACRSNAEHLTVADASRALGISETAVFRLSESRQIHSFETSEGRLMLCAESLKRFEAVNNIYRRIHG